MGKIKVFSKKKNELEKEIVNLDNKHPVWDAFFKCYKVQFERADETKGVKLFDKKEEGQNFIDTFAEMKKNS